jgi:putative ABC transport system permease protein
MPLEPLRELRRHALRSALTAGGIAIGVGVLVLLGALSEKVSRLVTGGRDFATGQITVSGRGGSAGTGMSRGSLVSGEQLQALEQVDGVAVVAPIVMFPVSDTPVALPFTLAPMVFGVEFEKMRLNRNAPPPPVAAGRGLPSGDGGEVVVGSQVARFYEVGVGSSLTIRGKQFLVTGVLEQTFTGPDSFVFMPYPTAQRLLIDSEPLLEKLVLTPGARVLPIATAAAVFWAPDADPEVVAARIHETLPALSVVSPGAAAADLDRALAFLSAVILGSALAALMVAALAVTTTMLTAVVERRREIGLRRVVGATRRQVLQALLTEAAALGVAGSVLGIVGSVVVIQLLNAVTATLGAPIFLLTGRLVIVALALPPCLAAFGGLIPAWRAVRRTPTDAVRFA